MMTADMLSSPLLSKVIQTQTKQSHKTTDVSVSGTTDIDFQMRLDYASSTIYYSVLGVFAGGGYSEQVGDVRASRGGYTITMADRARFKSMGDALRLKWGWDVEDDDSSSEMYDATYMRM
jgi:hypothetical protein